MLVKPRYSALVFLLMASATYAQTEEAGGMVMDTSAVENGPSGIIFFGFGGGFGLGPFQDEISDYAHLSFRLGALFSSPLGEPFDGTLLVSATFKPVTPFLAHENDEEDFCADLPLGAGPPPFSCDGTLERGVFEVAYYPRIAKRLFLAGGVQVGEPDTQPYAALGWTFAGFPVIMEGTVRGIVGPDFLGVELGFGLVPMTALPLPF